MKIEVVKKGECRDFFPESTESVIQIRDLIGRVEFTMEGVAEITLVHAGELRGVSVTPEQEVELVDGDRVRLSGVDSGNGPREKHELTIVVGCGGLLYHGLSGIVCETKMRRGPDWEKPKFMLWDGDQYENRNVERQSWMAVEGQWKAAAAADTLNVITGFSIDFAALNVTETSDLALMTPYDRVIVLALPDNNECRRVCAMGAIELSKIVKEVWFVTAGNSVTGGQAWGARAVDGKWHPNAIEAVKLWDIWEPKEVETHGEQCDRVIEQSMFSNMVTTSLLGKVLQEMRKGAAIVEEWWETSMAGGLFWNDILKGCE